MSSTIKKHLRTAKSILRRNWTGSYTMPSATLYPHQWNWDSGFIAIGYSHYDTERAIRELTSLFEGQWDNGMLPHIVFNPRRLGEYFPEPDFWQAETSPNAPKDKMTSGITMPPVHGMAVMKIFENAPGQEREKVRDFLEWIYPRLLRMHRYFYEERNPDGSGLVYIRHPWESGMDNSPMWDKVMGDWELSKPEVPAYERRDLSKGVSSEMRPRDRDYDRFVYLLDLFRRHHYDESAISRDSPFLVYGPLFNSILCASNEALVRIADILHEDTREPQQWYELTRKAIGERLYNPEQGIFNFYDLNKRVIVDVETAAGFIPLLCGAATKDQAERIYEYLNSRSFCALHQGNCFTIPNYDTRKEDFDRLNYWKGPVWININWLLMKGLRRYGYHQKADSVAKDILQLPIRFGFYEYFDSFDGRGYGSENFSWTAALFLDTAMETYEETGERPFVERLRKGLWSGYVLNREASLPEQPVKDLSQELLSVIKDIKSRYYTDEGIVDYDSIRDSDEYRAYRHLTAALRGFPLDQLSGREERLAFWINIYNTIIVDGIISLGIRSSVKEMMGFFSRVKYIIGGYEFSPDDIEHGILRSNRRRPWWPFPQFGPFDRRREFSMGDIDPRIHFVLVCGSRSCAPIKFYTPEGIDAQLERATINFVNSSEVVVIPEENRLVISKIFKWYASDFGGPEGVLNFIERYLVDDDKRGFIRKRHGKVQVEYLYYDWNLNK